MSVSWEFGEEMASADSKPWHLQLPPAKPAAGVEVESAGMLPWQLFCVRPSPQHQQQVAEIYARDADLIVRFEQSFQDSFAFQLNYRLLTETCLPAPLKPAASVDSLGIELWLSVQTDLLDASPALTVNTSAPSGSSWQMLSHQDLLGSAAVEPSEQTDLAALWSCAGDCTGVWLIDPQDQQVIQLESQLAERTQQLRLFGHFMEKGVIRRARMRFHLVLGELVASQLKELYQQFANSPLPLTA